VILLFFGSVNSAMREPLARRQWLFKAAPRGRRDCL